MKGKRKEKSNVAQLLVACLTCPKPRGQPTPDKAGMVVRTCNSSIWEVEERGSRAHGHPQLQ